MSSIRFIHIDHQLNDNLQQQARLVCDAWLREHDGEYQLVPLTDVATINPDTYSPSENWEYINYLDTSSVTSGVIADIQHLVVGTDRIPSRARRKVKAGDIVYSTVRPNQLHFGIINNPESNMLASTGFAIIRSQTPSVSNELIYILLTSTAFTEKMQQLAEQSTSTFPSIKPSDLSSLTIPLADEEAIGELLATLKAISSTIANNQSENNRLADLRDSLLPKLMSGEIDVSAVQLGC